MSDKPNYYAIIPANVRYDKQLRANEKLMYGEITALSNVTGECWASNNYFSELYQVTPQAISKWISDLKDRGYISVDIVYKDGTKEIDKRVIRITEVSTNDCEGINKCLIPPKQMFKGNNINTNNTRNNITTTSNIRQSFDWSEYSEEENTSIYPFGVEHEIGLTIAEACILGKYVNEPALERYLNKIQDYDCKDKFTTIISWAKQDRNYKGG